MNSTSPIPRAVEARRLLPHEMVFGLALALLCGRLLLAVGPWAVETLRLAGLLGVNVAVVAWARRREGWWSWQVRLWFYLVAMNLTYFAMKTAVPEVEPAKFDALLQAADRCLVGGNLSLRLEPWIRPWLTDLLSGCYFLLFPYLVFSLFWHARGPLPRFQRFVAGLFVIYGIGFLGYQLLPAAGPWVAMKGQFHVPLTGGWLTELNTRTVTRGSNGVDVFPSLHCAASAWLLAFDFRHRRWRFWGYLLPCVGLWFSTLYLRYHYAVDLVAGFALTAFTGWWMHRWFAAAPARGRRSTQSSES